MHRDDGELEQIMVVVSLSFQEVFSSRINRARARTTGECGPLGGHACGFPRSTAQVEREADIRRDEKYWQIKGAG